MTKSFEFDGPPLSFIKPHMPGQSGPNEGEKQLVAAKFQTLHSDVMLGFVANVVKYPLYDLPPCNYSSLQLVKPDEADSNIGWTLNLLQNHFAQWPTQEAEAEIEHRLTRGANLEDIQLASMGVAKVIRGVIANDYRYYLAADGVVYRKDITRSELERRQTALKHAYPPQSTKDWNKAFVDLGKELREGLKNDQLETRMGVNNQPITAQEMDGLETYARQPGFLACT